MWDALRYPQILSKPTRFLCAEMVSTAVHMKTTASALTPRRRRRHPTAMARAPRRAPVMTFFLPHVFLHDHRIAYLGCWYLLPASEVLSPIDAWTPHRGHITQHHSMSILQTLTSPSPPFKTPASFRGRSRSSNAPRSEREITRPDNQSLHCRVRFGIFQQEISEPLEVTRFLTTTTKSHASFSLTYFSSLHTQSY